MNPFWPLLLFAVCTGFCSSPTLAKQDWLAIGTSETPNLIVPPNKTPGKYNKVLSHFSDIRLVFAGPMRVGWLFDEKQLDCLFPASTATMPDKLERIQSLPISQTSAYVFSLKPYGSLDDFTGKTLAIQRGLRIGNVRQKIAAEYVELASGKALIEFVHRERAHGFVAYLIDMKAHYKGLGQPVDFYLATEPVHQVDEAIVCHNTAENQFRLERINAKIRELSDSGVLQTIMQP